MLTLDKINTIRVMKLHIAGYSISFKNRKGKVVPFFYANDLVGRGGTHLIDVTEEHLDIIDGLYQIEDKNEIINEFIIDKHLPEKERNLGIKESILKWKEERELVKVDLVFSKEDLEVVRKLMVLSAFGYVFVLNVNQEKSSSYISSMEIFGKRIKLFWRESFLNSRMPNRRDFPFKHLADIANNKNITSAFHEATKIDINILNVKRNTFREK